MRSAISTRELTGLIAIAIFDLYEESVWLSYQVASIMPKWHYHYSELTNMIYESATYK
jgi:hypothetical protein